MRNWNNWNGHKKCGQLSIVGKMFSPRLGRLFAKKAIDEKGQQVRKQGCDWPAIVNCFWQQWPRHQQDGNYFLLGAETPVAAGGSSLLVVKREICPPSVHWGRKNGKLHLICRLFFWGKRRSHHRSSEACRVRVFSSNLLRLKKIAVGRFLFLKKKIVPVIFEIGYRFSR